MHPCCSLLALAATLASALLPIDRSVAADSPTCGNGVVEGTEPYPTLCDVNGDGACNIGDALRIAQCDVGLIPCAFTCGPIDCPAMPSEAVRT